MIIDTSGLNNLPYVATTLFGLESILAKELLKLGAENVTPMNRAVAFSADKKMLYKLNFGVRTAIRILKNIDTFKANKIEDIYQNIFNIGWEDIFSYKNSFMINSVVNSALFKHSHYIAQKSKDAIADRFRKKYGLRPSVNKSDPDILINIHITDNLVNVALDSSGEPLFKRGYRVSQYIAPLNEVLAAGMLMMAGWQGEGNFCDPMCGSGTLPIEAALIAKKLPPGIFRNRFAFMKWNDYDESLFLKIKEQMITPVEFKGTISASDISGEAVSMTKRSLRKAMLDDIVTIKKEDFRTMKPQSEKGLIIFNPPYSERLKESEIECLYKEIGDTLKKKYTGFEVWILSANLSALKFIGLHPQKKYELFNGSLRCKFQQYLIYEGSLKKKKLNN